jgi:TRAP-type C4-dicarboxylate transport system permease small subunit
VQGSEVSFLDVLERTFDRTMRGLELLLAGLFMLAVALNFLNVVDRYLFNQSLFGVDEIQIYILVWITFFGAVVVTWRNQHLRMDVLLMRFPRGLRMTVFAVELVLVLGLATMMAMQSTRYVALMHTLDRKSDLGGIPMWIPHSALAVGFGLIAAVAIWRSVVFLVRHKGHQEPVETER